MSLIPHLQTVRRNPFDYLTELQRHAQNWRPHSRGVSRGTIATLSGCASSDSA